MEHIVSSFEMAELERQTVEELGVGHRVLMEVAGRAVAQAVGGSLAAGSLVAVACGPGNNGGDGFVTARALVALGHAVKVFVVAERSRLKGDAHAAFVALEKSGGAEIAFIEDARAVYDFATFVRSCDVVVDALLGTGARGEVRGLVADVIDVVNDSKKRVIAVDLPSGVDADTGAVFGRGVQASATVTFAFAKRGHYLFPGAELTGELVVADIGIPRGLAAKLGVVARAITPHDGRGMLPRRPGMAHKGSFGHVVAFAGAARTPGAALLALHGALRTGAGLVSWACDETTLAHAKAVPPEVMLKLRADGSPDEWAQAVLEGATSVVIGPGLTTTDERLAELRALLAEARVPLVLDADALNLIAAHPDMWGLIQAPCVITPHPKEMARLMSATVEEVQRDRFAVAMQVAASRSCTVVLKGAGTVIADNEGGAWVVAAGNPGMATGGSGDVLAGVIGALLAQGLPPAEAAQAGALLHAEAGDRAARARSMSGMIASDIVEHLGEVLVEWQR